MHEINSCQWDKETKVLTNPGEKQEQENSAYIESAAWYHDEVGDHMVDNKKKSKSKYAAAEALYNLDGDQSVKKFMRGNIIATQGRQGRQRSI